MNERSKTEEGGVIPPLSRNCDGNESLIYHWPAGPGRQAIRMP